jgi:uncharacterized protein
MSNDSHMLNRPIAPSRNAEMLTELSAAIAYCLQAFAMPVLAVYLHGSYATAAMRPDSDLDIALLSDEEISPQALSALQLKIYDAIGHSHECDIAQLRRVKTVFAAQVITTGQRIYVADLAAVYAADQFEMQVLADYARLNEERAGIVADIIKRGTVYHANLATTASVA